MSIQEKIKEAIDAIEQYCELLLLNQKALADNYMENMVICIGGVIPDIISEYDKVYLSDKREEQQYWFDQISRITGALASDDLFYQIDVLRNETAENLKYFSDLISK